MEINNRASSTATNNSELTKPSTGSFGQQLKQARVSKGLSIDDVAGELFILKRHLEAIESESFSELPQLAFARGFVVNYAKFVGLDPEQIADNFNRAYPDSLKKESIDDIESPLRPLGTLQREGRRPIRVNPLLVIGLVALVILAVFLIRTVTSAEDASDASEDAALVDDLSDTEQSEGAALNTGSAVNLNNADADLQSAGSALNLNNVAESNLEFWVMDNVNINVTDADGKKLLNGNQARGAYALSGKPPFEIQIDNVSKVTLNMDKQPIELNKFASNNKADFTLKP